MGKTDFNFSVGNVLEMWIKGVVIFTKLYISNKISVSRIKKTFSRWKQPFQSEEDSLDQIYWFTNGSLMDNLLMWSFTIQVSFRQVVCITFEIGDRISTTYLIKYLVRDAQIGISRTSCHFPLRLPCLKLG